jgi:hypothetical protein
MVIGIEFHRIMWMIMGRKYQGGKRAAEGVLSDSICKHIQKKIVF